MEYTTASPPPFSTHRWLHLSGTWACARNQMLGTASGTRVVLARAAGSNLLQYIQIVILILGKENASKYRRFEMMISLIKEEKAIQT